jgi:glycosyltransferase involved in cell wall biosynthesis
MKKLIRITTVPVSLLVLLRGQLQFMSQYYDVLAVSSKGAELDLLEKQPGLRIAGVNMTRRITPFKDLAALWNLYRLLKREKPEMVHTHTPKAGLLGMLAAQLAGVPVRLHTVAGMPLLERQGLIRKVLELAEKLTYRCATKVYPNSQAMKQLIESHRYCSPKKLKVIGNGSSNGIDTSVFDPQLFTAQARCQTRESIGISANDIVYCFIGRMVADKGVKELVEAFLKISQHNRSAKLLLIGPFESQLDPLNKFIVDQILNHPSIIWKDFQTDVRPYLSIADIFVFPSYREGFPNVVMQAGAMNLPCIVTNINGCNEIIQQEKNGIIVPVKNPKALQNAMEQLTHNPELRKKLSINARQMIATRYDQHYVMNELLKEYLHFTEN